MQTPVNPIYMMQPSPGAQPRNIIIAGSPVVSPSEVFPEKYALPPIGLIPPPLYHPFPPRPFGFHPYGLRYGYPYPYPYPYLYYY